MTRQGGKAARGQLDRPGLRSIYKIKTGLAKAFEAVFSVRRFRRAGGEPVKRNPGQRAQLTEKNAMTHPAERYGVRVPRYTSYPTAPHFRPGFPAADYAGWLAALEPETPLSLYFHIPFCDAMCWFCGCYTKIVQRREPVERYLALLTREIDLVADAIGRRARAAHVHFGGGSPTMLNGGEFAALFGHIRKRFDVADATEFAVELDPRTATEDYVRALAEAGVNRASIGVQDFDPAVQKAINRIQPYDMTARVIGWLRGHGIRRINMDLLYGLPLQTTQLVTEMVDKAAGLAPDRIALFGYAHVPWMKSHMKRIRDEDLPDLKARWEQAEISAARLIGHGYARVGLDHFAKPEDPLAQAAAAGRLRRNFQGYTTDLSEALVGFGASAIGSFPQGYVQNLSPLRDYGRAVGAGVLPVTRGLALSAEDRLRRDVIFALMCDMTVDVDAAAARRGMDAEPLRAALGGLDRLAADGYVSVDGGRVTVHERGRPLVRVAAAVFDSYLDPAQARHAVAV